jgi:hypothetical protein
MLRNSDTLNDNALGIETDVLTTMRTCLAFLGQFRFSTLQENATLNLRTANTQNRIKYSARIHRCHLRPSLSVPNSGYVMMCQTVKMPSQCLCQTLNVSRSSNPPDPILYISLLHFVGSPAFRLRPRAVPKKCELLTSS